MNVHGAALAHQHRIEMRSPRDDEWHQELLTHDAMHRVQRAVEGWTFAQRALAGDARVLPPLE